MSIVITPPSANLPTPIARAKIMRIQMACYSLPDNERIEPADAPLKHWLAPGTYCREIHLTGGTVVVGRIHRHRHMNIISKGAVTVYTEFGYEHFEAPASFISEAGTKRVVWVHEDTIWTTIHPNPTDETNVSKLEEMFTAAEYAELKMEVETLGEIEWPTL